MDLARNKSFLCAILTKTGSPDDDDCAHAVPAMPATARAITSDRIVYFRSHVRIVQELQSLENMKMKLKKVRPYHLHSSSSALHVGLLLQHSLHLLTTGPDAMILKACSTLSVSGPGTTKSSVTLCRPRVKQRSSPESDMGRYPLSVVHDVGS